MTSQAASPKVSRAATTLFLRRERARYLPEALEASLSALATDPSRQPGPGATKSGQALNRAAAQRLLAFGLPQGSDEAYSTVRLNDLMPRLESVPSLPGGHGTLSFGDSAGGASPGGTSNTGPDEKQPSFEWLDDFIAQATDTAGLMALAYAPVQIRSLLSPSTEKTAELSQALAPTRSSTLSLTFTHSAQHNVDHQVAALALEIGENQTAQLGLTIEVRASQPASPTLLANTFVAIHIKAEASLDLWVSEPAHEAAQSLTQIVIRQEAGSRLRLHLGTLGNALARTSVHLELAGVSAQAEILGTAALMGKRQAHRHVHVVHRMPQATSKQLFKTVATDTARSSVDGTIEVAPLAKGTAASQTLRNLLLSETARVDSKPRLLIRNDDVKCNHGSTTGQLDDNQRFYLRSRGLTDAEATALLTGAFLHETLDVVPPGPHRAFIESVLPHLLAEVRT
jgi:SUF system FeS cluster assembly, SufBD